MENSLLAYVLAITVLSITPGMDTMLVIRNTTRGGWKDGATSSLGICLGLFGHAAISAVGISVLLLHSAWAFRLLKLAGASYLIWLGLVSMKSALGEENGLSPDNRDHARQDFSIKRSLVEGFLSNILNPKAVIFYMAFLPQFIDPSRPALSQSLFLAGIHFVIAMVWQVLVASLVDRAKMMLGKSKVRRAFDGLTGSIMMFFGISLGLDR